MKHNMCGLVMMQAKTNNVLTKNMGEKKHKKS